LGYQKNVQSDISKFITNQSGIKTIFSDTKCCIMVTKKSKHADLRRKRGVFFNTGLVIALAFTLLSFEWDTSTFIESEMYHDYGEMPIEEQMINIPLKKPEPPKPKIVKQFTIKEVEDNTEVTEEPDINIEVDPGDEVEIPIIIAEPIDDSPVETFQVEVAAQFKGGLEALYSFINNHIKYPEQAREIGIAGRVYVKFVVDKTGKITNPQIIRSPDVILSNEALRIVNMFPDWEPAIQNLERVSTYYTIPINFKLN